MVHGLASQLGGAVTIASKPGLGTSVDLLLPQSNAEPVEERAPSSHSAEAASGRIVLVDDEPGVRASTAEMLIDLGYDVVEFDRATEALTWLDGNQADLVVTDHLMPGMSGTDFARRLTAERPELRTLIVSGYADLECISPDLPRLSKPFRMAELAEALVSLQR
jgi:CheY-like chemotaxis protein